MEKFATQDPCSHLFYFDLKIWFRARKVTVEPRYNEPLCKEDLDITKDFLYPRNSKIYENEPRYNETLLQRTIFASSLALRYIEVPL